MKLSISGGALCALVLALPAPTALASDTLVVNGKPAPADLRTINGSAYVRLSDVAKALGMILVKRPGGYEITKAGGANQIEGALQGKIGDTLFDGRWRLQVLSVQTADEYALKSQGELYNTTAADYDPRTRVLRPKPGNTLILIRCRVANGQKTPQTLWLGHGDIRTAIADADGGSHEPAGFDVNGAPSQTERLLPGAKLDIPVIFCVPAGTQLKDLIFTLHNNDWQEKGNDARISLTPGAG